MVICVYIYSMEYIYKVYSNIYKHFIIQKIFLI